MNVEKIIIAPVHEILRLSHCVGAVKVKSKARTLGGHWAIEHRSNMKARKEEEEESMADEE